MGSTEELFIENKEKTPAVKPNPKKSPKEKPEKYYDFDTDSTWDGRVKNPSGLWTGLLRVKTRQSC